MSKALSVSVIIPTRNRPDSTVRAIRSVLDQSLAPEEIIVVDDASTDETAFRIQQAFSERVTLVRHSSPRGANAARNTGIDIAQGSYLAFLDSDDYFLPDKLKRQVERLNSERNGFSVTGWRTDTGRVYCPSKFKRTLLMKSNILGGTSGLVATKELLKDNRFDPVMMAVQDWELFLRLSKIVEPAIINDPLYIYAEANTDRITRNARRRALGHFQLYRRHIIGREDGSQQMRNYHRLVQIELTQQAKPGLFPPDYLRQIRRAYLWLARKL